MCKPSTVAAGVEDARLGVSALLSERDSAVWGAVEVDAEIDQAPDGSRPLGGEDFDGRCVTEPVAGADRVGGVALRDHRSRRRRRRCRPVRGWYWSR